MSTIAQDTFETQHGMTREAYLADAPLTAPAETEADYNRLAEYHAANDELRRLSRRLATEADDDNYDRLYGDVSAQRRLVREIARTVTCWTA